MEIAYLYREQLEFHLWIRFFFPFLSFFFFSTTDVFLSHVQASRVLNRLVHRVPTAMGCTIDTVGGLCQRSIRACCRKFRDFLWAAERPRNETTVTRDEPKTDNRCLVFLFSRDSRGNLNFTKVKENRAKSEKTTLL